jgi:hypothetical protein
VMYAGNDRRTRACRESGKNRTWQPDTAAGGC